MNEATFVFVDLESAGPGGKATLFQVGPGAAWLARMDPELAVVSYGENGYGHPTSEALCRIQQAGAAAEVQASARSAVRALACVMP